MQTDVRSARCLGRVLAQETSFARWSTLVSARGLLSRALQLYHTPQFTCRASSHRYSVCTTTRTRRTSHCNTRHLIPMLSAVRLSSHFHQRPKVAAESLSAVPPAVSHTRHRQRTGQIARTMQPTVRNSRRWCGLWTAGRGLADGALCGVCGVENTVCCTCGRTQAVST